MQAKERRITVSTMKLTAVALAFGLALSGCGRGDTFASVDDRDVSNGEIEAHLEYKRVPEDAGERREREIGRYLRREALAQAIEKTDALDPAAVQARLNEYRQQVLISEYFDRYLEEQVSDEAVRNYYSNHIEDYEHRKIRVAHILLRTNRGMTEAERKAVLTEAQEARSQIRAGESFDEVAKAYSEDRISAKKGGDLGWIKQGSISGRFSDKAFSVDPGAVAGPFETDFGFHVIKVLEGPKTVRQPFDAVKGNIRHQLRTQAKQAEIERLRESVSVERHDDAATQGGG